ncbi:hypothetical protein ABZX69_25740 [Streptomyces sp. NPDC004074]|uniref:hypothetical protein n=1 Tax=unclassified Streptomyces TaxID=2593676 RepID=UPI0033A968AD
MRWILIGEEFEAAYAHRLGLIREGLADGASALERAQQIARVIGRPSTPPAVRIALAPPAGPASRVTPPPSPGRGVLRGMPAVSPWAAL